MCATLISVHDAAADRPVTHLAGAVNRAVRGAIFSTPLLLPGKTQEIFGSYGKVTSVDLAVDKRVNLPKV